MIINRVSEMPNTIGANEEKARVSVPKSIRFYLPELDVLRFAAFLLVFFCHTISRTLVVGPHRQFLITAKAIGGLGVPVFFFLSAYLITELLVIEKKRSANINIRNFYVRRILRIWPLYFAFLLIAYAIGELLPAYRLPAAGLPYYLLLAGNWWTGASGYAGILWTISVEEQFYIIWPTLAKHLTSRALSLLCAVVWFSAQAILILFVRWHAPVGLYILPNSFVDFQFFALGALGALLLKGKRPSLSPVSRLALISAGGALFYLAEYLFSATVRESTASFSMTMPGFLLIDLGLISLFLGFLGARLPRSISPLVYLGKISYGLYVFHVLLLNLVVSGATRLHYDGSFYLLDWILALPLTVLVAHLSYRLFEAPFLLLKERFTVVESRAI